MAEPTVSEWGVTVAEVAELASHSELNNESASDPEFGNANDREVTTQDVERWIANVEATVDLKLRKRAALTPEAQARVLAAGKTVVLNGAAAYLVDAAYPARTGVGDNSSYGSVLWNRYKAGLEELKTEIDEWVEQGAGEDDTTGGSLGIGAFFPAPTFTDGMKW